MAADHDRPFGPVVWRDEREHIAVLRAVARARSIPPTRNAVESASARAASEATTLALSDARGRPAGPRIDDVTVAVAVGDDELLAGAARADRGIPQPQAGDRPLGQQRRHEVDPPAAAAAADGEQAAAAGGKQRVSDARRRAGRRSRDRARSPCRWRRGSVRCPAAEA